MDTWNNKRANAHNQIPASAQEGDDTCGTPPTTPEIFQPSPSITPSTQEKKKKTQEKIEGFLQHVVGNSTIFISTFHQSTELLKNMDRNFAALLEKL
jgi:hypothetical protein